MARNFYWEMAFSPTLSENRPVIKNPFQLKFSQIRKQYYRKFTLDMTILA